MNSQPVFVILTPGFPASESDNTCLPFLQNVVKTINRDFGFIKVIIVSFQYPFTASQYLWNNNAVIPFGGKNKGGLSRILLWRRVWRQLEDIHNSNKIMGIFSVWLGECALTGKRFGKKYGITQKSWIVGQDAKEKNKYVKRIKPNPEDLVAISDFIEDEFLKNYSTRPQYVITNGIDAELFANPVGERTIDVAAAGSLISLKQYDLFIDVVKELKNHMPAIQSTIVGKGPEEKSLQQKISVFNLEENITMRGEVSYADVLELMQQTKIFLHPSSYEGFSMVCLEALYAGCHVISFCKPMKRDFSQWHIVKNKNEMAVKALKILLSPGTKYERIFPYSIQQTTASLMKLFGY